MQQFLKWREFFLLCMVMAVTVLAVSAPAFAETCSSDYTNIALESKNSGLVTSIMATIINLLKETGGKLYEHILESDEYKTALAAAVLISVTMFGIMVVLDMENLKPGVIAIKLFKIGTIAWLCSPGGWSIFSEIIAKIFLGTMLELTNMFLGGAASVMAGVDFSSQSGADLANLAPSALAEPLNVMGYPLAKLFSAKYIITMGGLFFTGHYGIVMAILMLWAGFQLLLALFQAIFVYIKCIVGLWFMFALAPIFFICLLFQRTRNLFDGWLNMVISFTLQPILLFAYLSFFLVVILTSLNSLMSVEWCLRPVKWVFGIPGVNWDIWRPAIVNGINVLDGVSDDWNLFGHASHPNLQFPLDLIDILFFILATYLCHQYGNFVPQLSSQLSQGGLNVGTSSEEARQFFQQRGLTPEQLGTKAFNVGLVKPVKGLVGVLSRMGQGGQKRSNPANELIYDKTKFKSVKDAYASGEAHTRDQMEEHQKGLDGLKAMGENARNRKFNQMRQEEMDKARDKRAGKGRGGDGRMDPDARSGGSQSSNPRKDASSPDATEELARRARKNANQDSKTPDGSKKPEPKT